MKRVPHNRIKIDVNYVVEEYTKGRSAQDIGKELGVSKKTILTRLKENEISRRQSPKYEEITENILRDLYIDKKLSTREIAGKYGCSNRLVLKRLHEYGIPVRKHAGDPAFTSEERKEKWGRPLERHNLWQGGITSLNESLRNVTYEWRDEHLRKFNYRCYITGKHSHDLHVHHVKPFNVIRDEALVELKLDKRESVKDYTLEEIEALKDLVAEKHEYEKGYPIDSEIHTLFHSLYGFKTTEADLLEFKQRYNSGEFDEKEASA